jgi:heme-degrading monooxygenase HmoA
MLRRDVEERSEFVMFTLWDSLDALVAFATEDYEAASSNSRTRGT